MAVEKIDKRFGVVAVEKGFITPEQLIEAMKIQILENLGDTNNSLIGQILLEKGFITTEQIDEVLKTIGI
jgi:hypothetical protein